MDGLSNPSGRLDQYGWGKNMMNQPCKILKTAMCRTGNQGDEEGRRKGRGERQKRGRGANMDARWAKKGASSECARRRDIRDGRQGHGRDSI